MFKNTICRRALIVLSVCLTFSVQAQTNKVSNWPVRPIKVIVAGPAGSGGDIFARMITVQLQEALKLPVIVDNKGGANGIIGNDSVAKSAPDGYTFLFTPSSSIAISNIAHVTEDLCNAQFPHLTPIDAFSFVAALSYPTQIPFALSNGPTLFDNASSESANALSSFDS
jgi:tripartite-type tricarboxylate transporter receptor subunit TctC